MRHPRLAITLALLSLSCPFPLHGVRTAVATFVPGGKPLKTDCYSVFDVAGGDATRGGHIDCTDGDPACDADGSCDNGCTFTVRLCVNQDGGACGSPGLRKPPRVRGASLPAPGLTGAQCGAYADIAVGLRRKGRHFGSKKITARAVGTNGKTDRDVLVLRCLPRPEGPCPTSTTSSTSSTTSTSNTSTTSTTILCQANPPGSCCGAERTTLMSSAGTLKVGGFQPFPFPSGVITILDAGPPDATCRHSVTIPAGGFVVPPFCIPALQYTSSVTATGCRLGTGVGSGFLWDGNATMHGGTPMTAVTKNADSSDGFCDTSGVPCANRDLNVLGDVDETFGVGGDAAKIATQLDIPAHSRTWQNAAGCPGDGGYDPADGDTLVTEFDFILSPTTGQATGAFVDKNGDACDLPAGSAGFGAPSAECGAGAKGPCTARGIQPPGPCCCEHQSVTVVTVGEAFSNSFPLYDLGFNSAIPSAVTSCDPYVGDTCTLSMDPCKL